MKISEKEYQRILAQPGYSSNEPAQTAKRKPSVKMPKMHSKLEAKFAQLWQIINGPELLHNDDTSFRFSAERNWRFDFYHVGAKVAIEIQGNGRHTQYNGYRRDREKINEAQRLGWTVFELTGDQIGWPQLERIRDFINDRIQQ